MGGLYGHMEHPHDINNFTFGDLKELTRDFFSGRISGMTEKLDGMNVFATVNTEGEVRFARNGGQAADANGGMNITDMEERWSDDVSIFNAYKNAYRLFSDAVAKLDDPVGFFNGDGYRLYANCEVIDPQHPNVIKYGKTTLSIHGLIGFTTGEEVRRFEVPENENAEKMDILKRVLCGMSSQYGTVQITPCVSFVIKDGEELVAKFISDIDHVEEISETDDNTRIIDYKKVMLRRYFEYAGLSDVLSRSFMDHFITRWAYKDRTKNERPEIPNAVQLKKMVLSSGIENSDELYRTLHSFEKDNLDDVFKELMIPVENFVYALGNAAISSCRGFANEGFENETIASLVKQMEETKRLVADNNDDEMEKTLRWCLNVLDYLGNKYNITEGIVFNYKGHTLKLTGSFAALNKAINLRFVAEKKQKNQD